MSVQLCWFGGDDGEHPLGQQLEHGLPRSIGRFEPGQLRYHGVQVIRSSI